MSRKNTRSRSKHVTRRIDPAHMRLHTTRGNVKIGEILSWSLVPGSGIITYADGVHVTDVAGTCDGCCEHCEKACYARGSFMRYPSCQIAWSENTLLYRIDPDGFFGDLRKSIVRYSGDLVRGHVAGEIPDREYLRRLVEMAGDLYRICPDKIIYLYTKRYAWVNDWIRDHGMWTPNLQISFSMWHDPVPNPYGLPLFIYDDGYDPVVAAMPHCPAVSKTGKKTGVTCDRCMRCPRGLTTAVYAH